MNNQEKYHRHLLNASHCAYLLMCAAYIAFMYPVTWPSCLLLSCCWVFVAFMPVSWRQKGIGEISFLIVALFACGLQWYIHDELKTSIEGLSRIIIVTLVLVLIPNRPGLVRPLAMLVALELLLLNDNKDISLNIVILLSIFALSALFLDSWMRHQYSNAIGVRFRKKWSTSPWKPMFLCLLLLCLVTFPLAHVLQQIGLENRFIIDQRGRTNGNMSNRFINIDKQLHIGSAEWTDQDSYVIARYFPDRRELISKHRSIYIRALAVPQLLLEKNGQISWRSPQKAIAYSGQDIEPIALGSGSTLIRFRTGDNILLRPDGANIPHIRNFFFDSEENLFTDETDISVIRYRCGIPKISYARTQRNAQRQDTAYLAVPEALQILFQQKIPQLEQWRVLSADQAASQVSLYLQRRCRYSTRNLPQPKNVAAGCIHTFLFGTRDQRIGHCQYFSSSATLLLRSCGHAARPVFGFSSPETGPEGKSIIFRAWHGHAWTEYIDNSGNWHRLDTTPGGYLEQRIDPHKFSEVLNEELDLPDVNEQSLSYKTFIVLILFSAGVSLIIYFIMKRPLEAVLDPRQKQLALQQVALLSCARQLGIQVKDSHTLSLIVRKVEQFSGLDLSRDLRVHLEALYNDADIPENWPIESIIAAVRLQTAKEQTSNKSSSVSKTKT